MSSLVVVEGDCVAFEPMFGPRQVVLLEPAMLRGSGEATIEERCMCVVGDEKRVQWQAQYFLPGYTPGAGMVAIESLDGSQVAPCVTSGAALILIGQRCVARFRPTAPATLISLPNTPDVMTSSTGYGHFIPRQIVVYAG
jgi:hypothetical protein